MLRGDAIAHTAAGLIRTRPLAGHEQAALDRVAAWLHARGAGVEWRRVPGRVLAAHPFHSAEIERAEVPVLLAQARGHRDGPTLLLNAHVDVVAAEQPGWSGDPFAPTAAAGVLRGRGAADTLGGLAAAMHVMAALAASPQTFDGRVLLTPVVGEEEGGCGTLAALISGITADAAVVIEPTDLAIATASAGALCFRVTVPGRTAHGSVRHRGVSAIEKAWPIHAAVRALEVARAAAQPHPLYDGEVPFPICMGRIEGGDYRCDEAAWVHIEGRLGTHPAEPAVAARAALEDAVAAAARADDWLAAHPPTVNWIGAQWVGGDTDPGHPLVAALRAASPDSAVVGVPFGCDMGLLRQVADIPTVVFGPGSAAVAHAPDEHVAVADLAAAARSLLALARSSPR